MQESTLEVSIVPFHCLSDSSNDHSICLEAWSNKLPAVWNAPLAVGSI